jgi:hypothetical protein
MDLQIIASTDFLQGFANRRLVVARRPRHAISRSSAALQDQDPIGRELGYQIQRLHKSRAIVGNVNMDQVILAVIESGIVEIPVGNCDLRPRAELGELLRRGGIAIEFIEDIKSIDPTVRRAVPLKYVETKAVEDTKQSS